MSQDSIRVSNEKTDAERREKNDRRASSDRRAKETPVDSNRRKTEDAKRRQKPRRD